MGRLGGYTFTLAATLVLLASTLSYAQEWVEQSFMADRFAISMPTKPAIKEITYKTEYGVHVLPARVYTSDVAGEHYSVTVVDYSNLQKMEQDRVKECRATGKEGDVCMDIFMHDMRGAVIFATWNQVNNAMKKGSKITRMAYSRVELVEGEEVYMDNPDGSTTITSNFMHENKLFILEGTVPANTPPPNLFHNSLGFLNDQGVRIRYATPYANGLPKPALARGGQQPAPQQP
jgi:hypothetical protein